ncbi:hypothetical protein ACAG39_01540 [Caldicellulosiruptoraceae bacterium PP1]
MLSKVSNRFLAVTILAIFVIALVGIITNKSLKTNQVSKDTTNTLTQEVVNQDTEQGYLQILVVDSKTNNPIEGVDVVLSNKQELLRTGKDGKTGVVTFSIAKDSNNISTQPFTEVTIGAFKQGYADYVLFNAKVKPSTEANPQLKIIRLVKTSTPTTQPVFAMEKYSSEMAKEMLNKMKEKLTNTSEQIEEIDISE